MDDETLQEIRRAVAEGITAYFESQLQEHLREYADRNIRTMAFKNPDGSITDMTFDLGDSGGPL